MTTCIECAATFEPGTATLTVGDESVDHLLTNRCAPCETDRATRFGGRCDNCGGLIPPGTQVGVTPTSDGGVRLFHTTFDCSPAGNTFYGVWGDGKLASSFNKVEQC